MARAHLELLLGGKHDVPLWVENVRVVTLLERVSESEDPRGVHVLILGEHGVELLLQLPEVGTPGTIAGREVHDTDRPQHPAVRFGHKAEGRR